MNKTGKGGFGDYPEHREGNGRPPMGETITDVLRNRVNKEEIADLLIAAAVKGNVSAQKYIYDRLDGMPRQSMELTGQIDKPVPLLILRANDATSTETG